VFVAADGVFDRREDCNRRYMQEADYIIIGGGSAGCVLANRLSADAANSVVVIEAGGEGPGFWVNMPIGSVELVGNERYDWIHRTEPDPTLNDREIIWNAGKMLGGGGSLNGLVYIRGQRDDFDRWRDMGCTGWGFNDVMPYFTKGERWDGEGDFQSHGYTGTLAVTDQKLRSPIYPAFIAAARHLGFDYIDDPAAGNIHGVFPTLTNIDHGHRCGPAQAYIEPARGRPNLRIMTDTLVDRIIFDGRQAVGVAIRQRDGSPVELRARREVILSAGATQSPAILMRSGIGPADHLRDHDIEVVHDSPQVGQNLMDHPVISHRRLIDVPSFNSMMHNKAQQAREMVKYLLTRKGLFTLSMIQGAIGAKTLPELDHPDVIVACSTWVFDSTRRPMKPGKAVLYPLLKQPAAGISTFVCRPYSRGEIRLRDRALESSPIIHSNLLGDERDVETLVRAEKIVEQMFAAPVLARHVTGRLTPELHTDEERRRYIRETTGIGWHASGTCRMGGDRQSVLDPRLRVRGLGGLRVADASIMPTVTSGNTNAPTMMIGEKASALILEDQAKR
jgi:choline dehydrogenase